MSEATAAAVEQVQSAVQAEPKARYRIKVVKGRHIGPQPRWWVDENNKPVARGTPGSREVRGRSKVYGVKPDGTVLPDGNVFETDTDLTADVYNSPGHAQIKRFVHADEGQRSDYEKRPDESAQDYANRLMMLALKAQDDAKLAAVQSVSLSTAPPVNDPAGTKKPRATPEFLAGIDKMTLQQLNDLAADEEIDVSTLKGEKEVRRTIKAALELRG